MCIMMLYISGYCMYVYKHIYITDVRSSVYFTTFLLDVCPMFGTCLLPCGTFVLHCVYILLHLCYHPLPNAEATHRSRSRCSARCPRTALCKPSRWENCPEYSPPKSIGRPVIANRQRLVH